MADETPVDDAPSTDPTPTSAVTLKEKVASNVVTAAPSLLDKVADLLAQPEIARRTQLLTDGYLKLEEQSKALSKIDRPDVDPKGRDGKSIGIASYSEARLKELKQTTDNIGKLSAAFEKAASTSASADDFNKLKEAIQKCGSSKTPSGDE